MYLIGTFGWKNPPGFFTKKCIFGPKISCFFSMLRPYNALFWPQTNLIQWNHIFPKSWGNSGYLRFSGRYPFGCSAGRFLALIAKNWPLFGANNACWLRRAGWSTLVVQNDYRKSRLRFLTQFGVVGVVVVVALIFAQERPKRAIMAQKGPKWPKNGQNLTLSTLLVVQNG